MRIFELTFKTLRKLLFWLKRPLYSPIAHLMLTLNGAKIGRGLRVLGFMKIIITQRGKVIIGENLKVNSGPNYNIIGRQQKSILWVEGTLIIGNNVGISSTAIICKHFISIGDYVTIGGNTVIYDTDFHSLDPIIRKTNQDKLQAKNKPVLIEDNVFIGAHSSILKGVTIGKNSIIGACSVVSKDIPSNEIWGGNPIVFIKKIVDNK